MKQNESTNIVRDAVPLR